MLEKWYIYSQYNREQEHRQANMNPIQPPKRRGAPASSSAAPKPARPSKLAKENNISAEEENEIKEVFQLFAEQNEEFPDEKIGVIPREDVRKALVYVRTSKSNRISHFALGFTGCAMAPYKLIPC